jgi:hypothetical protein
MVRVSASRRAGARRVDGPGSRITRRERVGQTRRVGRRWVASLVLVTLAACDGDPDPLGASSTAVATTPSTTATASTTVATTSPGGTTTTARSTVATSPRDAGSVVEAFAGAEWFLGTVPATPIAADPRPPADPARDDQPGGHAPRQLPGGEGCRGGGRRLDRRRARRSAGSAGRADLVRDGLRPRPFTCLCPRSNGCRCRGLRRRDRRDERGLDRGDRGGGARGVRRGAGHSRGATQ